MEESFGPVVGIMKVADDEEAIALMNDIALRPDRLDLDARHRRAERIGAQVETGTVFMNRCDYLDPAPGLDRRQGHRPRRDAVRNRLRRP